MKLVLLFDKMDGFESEKMTLGFEAESVAALEEAIRNTATEYMKDLPTIEARLVKLYNRRNLTINEINRRADEIRREPYLIRSGKYVLWAGDFVLYQFDGYSLYSRYTEPTIMTLDAWFDTITEKDTRLN